MSPGNKLRASFLLMVFGLPVLGALIVGEVGVMIGMGMAILGQFIILGIASSRSCPNCGEGVLSMSVRGQQHYGSFQVAFLELLFHNRCRKCGNKL